MHPEEKYPILGRPPVRRIHPLVHFLAGVGTISLIAGVAWAAGLLP